MASIGAGAIHAAAIGIHAEHRGLAQIFVVCAVLQLGAGLLALLRPSRPVAVATAAVNAGAVVGWLVTRIAGISWIGGLEAAEAPQFADTACALLGAVAVGAALSAAMVGWHRAQPPRLLFPGLAALALTVPAMVSGGTHVHNHDDGAAHDHSATAAAVDPATGDTVAGAAHDDGHAHDDGASATPVRAPGRPPTPRSTPTPRRRRWPSRRARHRGHGRGTRRRRSISAACRA